MRHNGRQPIVVTQLEFVYHHCVVLVDNGHHTEAEHSLKSTPTVKVLLTVGKNVAREEHLSHHQPMDFEGFNVGLHEGGLAHSSRHLKACQVSRAFRNSQDRQPGRDRSRGDKYSRKSCFSQ